jgi:hypothetical protein
MRVLQVYMASFKVLTAVLLKVRVFWDVTRRRLVYRIELGYNVMKGTEYFVSL